MSHGQMAPLAKSEQVLLAEIIFPSHMMQMQFGHCLADHAAFVPIEDPGTDDLTAEMVELLYG